MHWQTLWPWIFGIAATVVAVLAAGHVVLHKRDVRAAIGWVGLILLSPFIGASAYYLLGINRIRRRAARAVEGSRSGNVEARQHRASALVARPSAEVEPRFQTLNRMVARATRAPLLAGNSVEILINGDRAYPEMLAAIEGASRSLFLATYIFETRGVGERFTAALAAAAKRGVEVRVLVDGVGMRYSRPRVTRVLRRLGVRVAEFLPPRLPFWHPYLNLRNHRKCLLVDGEVAFTGGMNIRQGHLLAERPSEPIQDTHFRLRGPVLQSLFEIMAEDWRFATGERLEGAPWAVDTSPAGDIRARAIPDGPDENFETLRWTILAALTTARESVRIATPYFLPERPMMTALRLAAMRGLDVDILLPEKGNLRFVQWAATAQLWQVLEAGCRVWRVPPPFDHSKVLVIDGAWSLVGSANWDARSLRLNFELDVECYDDALARSLMDLTDAKLKKSRQLTLEEVDGRGLLERLRDGTVRCLAPYL